MHSDTSPSAAGEISTRALLALALPSAASAMLNNAYRVVDVYAVQWLGVAAQAALGAATFILIVVYALSALISAGAGPLLARAVGAGDAALQRQVLGSAVGGSALLGLLITAFFGLGGDQIAVLVGLSGEPAALLGDYLAALALGGVVFAFGPLVDACFFAMGNARLPLLLQVLFTVLNAVLNGLFIYVLGWGIVGAALASVVSRAVTAGAGIWALWQVGRWRLSDMLPAEMLRRIGRVGLPVALNLGAFAVVYWVLLAVAISPLGPEVNAALGVGFSALEGMSWPLFHGFGLAVASMVGRQLGAGRVDRAEAAVRLALPWSLGAGAAVALIFFFAAEPLCAVFTADPAVLAVAVGYAQVLAFSQPFVAIEALTEGTLSGAGDTRSVFWWSVPLNVLRIPLGWGLALAAGWGAVGVWWAISLTSVVKAAGKSGAVAWGRWRSLEL